MRRYAQLTLLSVILVVACEDDPVRDTHGGTDSAPVITIVFPAAGGISPAMTDRRAPIILVVTDDDSAVRQIKLRLALENVADHGDSYTAAEDFVKSNPDDLDWTEWMDYEPGESGSMLYRPEEPFEEGGFVLVAQARDPGGLMSEFGNSNLRHIRMIERASGPLLSVRDQYVGGIQTSVCNTPGVTGYIIRGLPVAFEFNASAEMYRGGITSYRYGWFDWDKPDDPSRWTVVETPSLPSEIKGTTPEHIVIEGLGELFKFEVTDWSGMSACAFFDVNTAEYFAGDDVLLIDDYRLEHGTGWAGTNGYGPSDTEHDQFWLHMLDDVAGFDPDRDVMEVDEHFQLSLVKPLGYKAIIWSVSAGLFDGRPDQSLLSKLIRFQPEDWRPGGLPGPQPTAGFLAQFLHAGGLLLIEGRYPLSGVVDAEIFPQFTPRFPLVYKYELGGDQDGVYFDQLGDFVGDESFPFRDLCLNAVDYTNPFTPLVRDEFENGCGRETERGEDEFLRRATPIDMSFSRLNLRPEAAGTGRYYEARGLEAELYNPLYFESCSFAEYGLRSCFEPIYGLGAVDGFVLTHGSPVAFWTSASAAGGPRSAVFGVPLVYFEPAEAKAAIEHILFDEWGMARKP
jgi:hypothetical protein